MKKLKNKGLNFPALKVFGMFLAFTTASCSVDAVIEEPKSMEASRSHAETTEDQLERLIKKTRQYYNFQVAMAQGYDVNLVYMPNMGDHFSDTNLLDETFDYLTPEVLIYIINEEGEREFVAVEYLVVKVDDTPPEGFIGDEDVWSVVGDFWALHAWVALENPDGVFHPTNVNVTY